MSSSPQNDLLLMGLTATGKTNFLVALDVTLDHQTDPDGLVHSDLAADRAYLQPLKEKWLKGEELERTLQKLNPPVHQLLVKHPPSGTMTGFHLPDLAGENFDGHFMTRSFSKDFFNRLKKTDGILLFVHADQNGDHVILEHPALMDPPTVAEPPQAEGGVPSIPIPSSAKEWELSDAAPQTKLVELLQFAAETRVGLLPLKVAVIISAWDCVENGPKLPENPRDPALFLKVRWPLLEQYLRSQRSKFISRVFGVSARGGGITPEEVARLAAIDAPNDRILVVDGAHRSHDLTRPVRWLLGLLKTEAPPNGQ